MLSETQKLFIITPLLHINILVGVTGSGKSFVANLKFYDEICKLKNCNVLLTGNTSESLYKNVIKELLKIDQGQNWLTYTSSPSRIKTIHNVEIFCVGINNEGSEKRLQGGNVSMWYADEPTTYPQQSFYMCLSRCRADKDGTLTVCPVIMTLNPDSSIHYIKTQFIDTHRLDVVVYNYGFYDNPVIDETFVQSMKQNYTGVFYDRMILGKWVGDASKLVIPEFTDEIEKQIVIEHKRPKHYEYYGSLDPGHKKDLTAYLLGYYDFLEGKIIIESELMLKHENTQTISERIKGLEDSTFPGKAPVLRVSDTEYQLIYDLIDLYNLDFVTTRKDFKEARIHEVRVLLKTGQIIINPRCINLIRHLKAAIWNESRTLFEYTENEGHFDMIDSLIYLVRNIDRTKNPYPRFTDNIQHDTHHINPEKKQISKELAGMFRRGYN